jgi:polyhydroxyalkanoate synthesis regulator phasin
MGLRRRLRKIIPREIRDNPALAIVAVAVIGPAALGALGASTAAIAGATVAANTAAAIAIGTGVVTAGITYVQGGTVSDSLKAGVLSGAGSYAGSVVSNSVSNAVSNATGAPLGGGVGATVTPSGQFASTAGGTGFGAAGTTGFQTAANAGQILGVANPTFAGYLAGNVVGRSVEAAITGAPIEQAALFGAAQSVGFGLQKMPDFNTLPKPVQNVLISSAQAAVSGQDVGDAVIASLVQSTDVVGKAIKQLPGGIEFTIEHPIYTKYVVDSVSSAIAAQLQGKDVSESVINSLVRTTMNVLNQKFQDSQARETVENANSTYQQAEQKQQQIAELNQQIENLKNEPTNRVYLGRQEFLRDQLKTAALNHDGLVSQLDLFIGSYNRGFLAGSVEQAQNEVRQLESQVLQAKDSYNRLLTQFYDNEDKLGNRGFYRSYNNLTSQLETAQNELSGLVGEIDRIGQELVDSSFGLYTDFETELATTLAPLTAFEETDVTDQDLLAEISPVAPPMQMAQLDPNISAQAEEIAREEFAKVAQGEEVAALPAVAIPAAANVLTRTAIQAAPAVVRKIGQFAANDPRFAQAVVENPYIQELLRAASLTAALGPNGELLINPIVQENESAAESARLYRYATQVQSEAVNVPPNVIQALEREARRFEDLAAQQDIENLIAPQPDMEVELTPEVVSPVEPIPEIDVRPAPSPFPQPTPEVAPEPILPPAPVEFPELLPDFAPIPRPVPRPSPAPEPATEPNRAPIDAPVQRPATQPELSPGLAEELGLLPQTRPAEEPQPRPAEQIQPSVRPREEDVVNRPIDFPEDIDDEEILRLIEEDINQPLGDITPEEEGEEGLEEEAAPAPAPEEPAAEGEEAAPTSPDIVPAITTVGRRTFARPAEGAPYRVTGMDESGILGRKQPLFGGDEDLQRAEWNRRSLRLRRLLGL